MTAIIVILSLISLGLWVWVWRLLRERAELNDRIWEQFHDKRRLTSELNASVRYSVDLRKQLNDLESELNARALGVTDLTDESEISTLKSEISHTAAEFQPLERLDVLTSNPHEPRESQPLERLDVYIPSAAPDDERLDVYIPSAAPDDERLDVYIPSAAPDDEIPF